MHIEGPSHNALFQWTVFLCPHGMPWCEERDVTKVMIQDRVALSFPVIMCVERESDFFLLHVPSQGHHNRRQEDKQPVLLLSQKTDVRKWARGVPLWFLVLNHCLLTHKKAAGLRILCLRRLLATPDC